ncbi:MAG: MFS transporter, partial [Planctomycetota bacterium]
MSRRPLTPLWRNRNFVLMWTSTAASGFGDRMIMSSALALLGAFGASAGSASINSQTQFFFVLPYVLLSLGVGWLADHLPRKWMLMFCDEARAGLLLLAATMIPLVDAQAALPEDQKWKVLALLTAIGCCAASFNPVRNAIVPDLMPRSQLQSANAVILTITVIASMVGQVVAPLVIDVEARATVRTALF